MRLHGNQFDLLVEALVDLYDYEGLGQLLRHLGQNLVEIVSDRLGMKPVAQAVIREAEKGRWIVQLIRKAHAEKGAHPGLSKVYESVAAPLKGETPNPYETFLLLSSTAFVGRDDLRKYVCKLNSPLESRVLLVRDPPSNQPSNQPICSGKTYSSDYVVYLAEALPRVGKPGFETLWLNLNDVDKDLETGEIKALAITERICDQLGLQLDEKFVEAAEDERKPRWGGRFSSWLKGQLDQRPGNVYWLVVDGFDRNVLSEQAHDLIKALANQIAFNLTAFRLILLGYPGQMTNLGHRAHREEIKLIDGGDEGQQELLKFFEHLYEASGKASDFDNQADGKETLARQLADEVARVLRKINPQDPRRIESLGSELTQRARDILKQ